MLFGKPEAANVLIADEGDDGGGSGRPPVVVNDPPYLRRIESDGIGNVARQRLPFVPRLSKSNGELVRKCKLADDLLFRHLAPAGDVIGHVD